MAVAKDAKTVKETWGKITLRKGVPVQFREQLIYLKSVYITEAHVSDLNKVQNDPQIVKKTKAEDPVEILMAKKLLTYCCVGIASDGISSEEAQKALLNSEYNPISSFPTEETVIRITLVDLDRDGFLLADLKRLQQAFTEMNYLIEEDVTAFFIPARG